MLGNKRNHRIVIFFVFPFVPFKQNLTKRVYQNKIVPCSNQKTGKSNWVFL